MSDVVRYGHTPSLSDSPNRPREDGDQSTRARNISVEHGGKCLACGKRIRRGTLARWIPREGIAHITCPGSR